MNWADYIILGILGLSCLSGLMRGFVSEALSLAVWFLAIVVAMMFGGPLADLMVDKIATPSLRQMAAFASLFILTLIIGSLISRLMGQLVKSAGLGGTDRLLGMGFGALRGLIIVLVILVLIPSLISVDQDPWWNESILIPYVLSLESWGRETLGHVLSWFSNITSK